MSVTVADLDQHADTGDYPVVNVNIQRGSVVVVDCDGTVVTGRFIVAFDDDEPDFGRGLTYRILCVRDGQVWEGQHLLRIVTRP